MAPAKFSVGLCVALLLAGALPALAQLSPSEPDPLARIRDATKSNVQACSATGESLCEQVAPKIVANAQGDSPLAGNLRRLSKEEKGHKTQASKEAAALAWAAAAFLDSGVDAHVEKYTSPNGGPAEQENVVAEIRGREKPDEWVLVGAHLDTWANGPGIKDYNCDAAMVIEAARDISRTGIRPRRSIRFVLFTGLEQGMSGSWAYVQSHRAELDRARAAIVFTTGCGAVTGYYLNGRHDIEPGLREAMRPIESMGAYRILFNAWLETDNFDFLLEGVPALTVAPLPTEYSFDYMAPGVTPEKIDIAALKHKTAVVAVTAFGIAERTEPIGPRQSRATIKFLLKTTDLEQEMKRTKGLWQLWESGERGRLP